MSTDLHDAEINSIQYDRDAAVLEVGLINENKEHFSIRFQNCIYFRATDMIHQNVVLKLVILSGRDFETEYIKSLINWTTSLTDSRSFLDDEGVLKCLQDVLDSNLFIAHFLPSYGAEICVVSRDEAYLS